MPVTTLLVVTVMSGTRPAGVWAPPSALLTVLLLAPKVLPWALAPAPTATRSRRSGVMILPAPSLRVTSCPLQMAHPAGTVASDPYQSVTTPIGRARRRPAGVTASSADVPASMAAGLARRTTPFVCVLAGGLRKLVSPKVTAAALPAGKAMSSASRLVAAAAFCMMRSACP